MTPVDQGKTSLHNDDWLALASLAIVPAVWAAVTTKYFAWESVYTAFQLAVAVFVLRGPRIAWRPAIVGAVDGMAWALIVASSGSAWLAPASLALVVLQSARSRIGGLVFILVWPIAFFFVPSSAMDWGYPMIVTIAAGSASIVSAWWQSEQHFTSGLAIFSRIGHEFKSPLANITSSLELMTVGHTSRRQREHIQRARVAAIYMRQVVENAHDFARIFTGAFSVDLKPVRLSVLLQQVMGVMRPAAIAKNIRLNVFLASGPLVLRTDSEAMKIILHNLINNAIKFTETGGVDVIVSKHREDRGGDQWVHFTVRDTGPGIHPKMMANLGEPFNAGNKYHPKQRGSGLGIANVRRLAGLLGGGFSFANRTDSVGAEFVVRFPATNDPQTRDEGLLTRTGRVAVILSIDDSFAAKLSKAFGEVLKIDQVANEAELLTRLETGEAPQGSIVLVDTASLDVPLHIFAMRCEAMFSGHVCMALVDRANLIFEPSASAPQSVTGFAGLIARDAGPEEIAIAVQAAIRMDLGADGTSISDTLGSEIKLPPAMALLAEDDDTLREAFQYWMSKAGLQVDAVVDGGAALGLLCGETRHQYAVAIVDYQMPVLDGRQLVDALRTHEKDGGLPRLPVIVVTAESRSKIDSLFDPGSIQAILEKPFDPGQLLTTIASQLVGYETSHPPLAPIEVPSGEQSHEFMSQQFFDRFSPRVEDLLAGIRDAVSRKDAHSVHKQAHQLKGLAGYFAGGRAMSEICASLPETKVMPADPDLWLQRLSSTWNDMITQNARRG